MPRGYALGWAMSERAQVVRRLALQNVAALEAVAGAWSHAPPAPPPPASDKAAKWIRQICSADQTQQPGMAESAISALCAPDASAARVLSTVVANATVAIEAIDADQELDPAACGLLPWGHMRLNALAVLLLMASGEQRCRDLLALVCKPCVRVLASDASRTDFEGVRLAATLVRNLAMPAPNRPTLGEADAVGALCRHVGHRDPNTAVVVAVALRLLVEATPANAARQIGNSTTEQGPFAPILAVDLTKLHPHARAELARFVCLTVSGAWSGSRGLGAFDASQLQQLTSAPALEFGAFLLASRHPMLHREACAALRAARAIWQQCAGGGAGGGSGSDDDDADGSSLIKGLLVTERPLPDVLQDLLNNGSLTREEVDGLI